MVQSRVYDFAALLTQGRMKALGANLFTPGIYAGFDPLIVSPALLQLQAGAIMMPNGVMVLESTNVDITPPIVSGNYTLTADHDDIQAVGGSPVTYTWRNGILPHSGNPNATSLAVLWLRYTGGPITAAMFSSPLKLRNGAILDDLLDTEGWLQAPFAAMCDVVKGANIVLTPASHRDGAQNLGLNITNTAAVGFQSVNFTIPLPPLPIVKSIQVFADLPNNASIGFRTTVMTLTGPATAGTAVAVNVDNTGGFAANDKVTFVDPSNGTQEVTSIVAIVNGTQFTANLSNNYTTSSTVTSLSQVLDGDGLPITTTPTSISGPATGLDTPVGTFVLGNSDTNPTTLGVVITMQPTTTGVFLKGFKLLGD